MDYDDDNPQSILTLCLRREEGRISIMIIIMVMDNALREGLGILLEDTNSITGNVFDGWEEPAGPPSGTNRS